MPPVAQPPAFLAARCKAAPRQRRRCRPCLPDPPLAAGYGVYGSEEECVASEAVVQATGIDPSAYPSPSFPPTACLARSRASGNVRGACRR
jgi:hypothetical protein